MKQEHSHGLADNIASADYNAVFSGNVDIAVFEHLHYSRRGAGEKLLIADKQTSAFLFLKERGFFCDEELEVFKRGRNAIRHIPKNGDRLSYETASGLEAVTGYLYLMESERLDEMFKLIFEEMGNE